MFFVICLHILIYITTFASLSGLLIVSFQRIRFYYDKIGSNDIDDGVFNGNDGGFGTGCGAFH